MTIQYELDFTIDYLTDLLIDLRYMAHIHSTASHSERISNKLALQKLILQIQDLRRYAYFSNIISSSYFKSVNESVSFSIDLYYGV
ncbi:MAG: hypothetical protein [Inoviridae sp.]|nr:MAG: hypothetical protein [Inoviridae sp.]